MNSRQPRTQVITTEQQTPVLRLRPSAEGSSSATQTQNDTTEKKSKPKVRWTEDVVDNEHMNKKKSKICCIFHPQREFGESSGESCSSSDSDSDLSDEEGARPSSSGKQKKEHKHCCDGEHTERRSSPNAYEKQPHYKNQSVLHSDAI